MTRRDTRRDSSDQETPGETVVTRRDSSDQERQKQGDKSSLVSLKPAVTTDQESLVEPGLDQYRLDQTRSLLVSSGSRSLLVSNGSRSLLVSRGSRSLLVGGPGLVIKMRIRG